MVKDYIAKHGFARGQIIFPAAMLVPPGRIRTC
jgi:hypothetical protein